MKFKVIELLTQIKIDFAWCVIIVWFNSTIWAFCLFLFCLVVLSLVLLHTLVFFFVDVFLLVCYSFFVCFLGAGFVMLSFGFWIVWELLLLAITLYPDLLQLDFFLMNFLSLLLCCAVVLVIWLWFARFFVTSG